MRLTCTTLTSGEKAGLRTLPHPKKTMNNVPRNSADSSLNNLGYPEASGIPITSCQSIFMIGCESLYEKSLTAC